CHRPLRPVDRLPPTPGPPVHTSGLDPVGQVDATIPEHSALEQLEVDLPAHGMEQRDSRPEQYRMDVETDLVDQLGLEERSGQLPAAHEANVLPVPALQVADELGDILPDDGDTTIGALGEGPREHVRLDPGVAPASVAAAECHLVGLPPHQDRVDGLPV